MLETPLTKIIERLDAMRKDETDDVQIRFFQKDKVSKAKVAYHHISSLFTVINLDTKESYKFDNIDLVAIEIYEMIMPKRTKK